jgi:opacity protein-like surface antigen
MRLRKLGLLSFLLLANNVHADQVTNNAASEQKEQSLNECKGSFAYLKIGSGASFSTKTDIHAPSAVWDLAVQGYDSHLGTRPIITGGIGYEFCPLVAADILFSYRPNFTYKKFQTAINTNNTPGFLGDKTRRFNLDIASLMGTAYLNGRGIRYLCWDLGTQAKYGEIYPTIGGGVGMSRITIYNFRSTGLPPIVSTLPSFASTNEYTVRYKFTYQLLGGFEYRYHNRWAISAGYRWFDVAKFKGPRYAREADGDAFDVGHNEWRIDFSANELFVELKVFI